MSVPSMRVAGAAPPLPTDIDGDVVVVKLGGNAMVDERLEQAFAGDIAALRGCGAHVVVVHGGGPQVTAHLDRLGIPTEFAAGLRVTTPEVMDVARMVLVGRVQRDIVNRINEHGPIAVGISGEDAHLMVGTRRNATVDGEIIDIGLVADVTEVNAELLHTLIDNGHIPVVSSIARGRSGEIYNVNSDTAAAAVAIALKADHLVMLTNVAGLYRNWPATGDVIEQLNASELAEILPTLSTGMVPKMEACLRAVRGGVGLAHVVDGRVAHSPLLALGDRHVGTRVMA